MNEWVFSPQTVSREKGKNRLSNLLKEDIDKWMLSDLPKVVASIRSREEAQGDRSQSCLPPGWTWGILSLRVVRTAAGSDMSSQSLRTLLSDHGLKRNHLGHFDLSHSIFIVLYFLSENNCPTKYYLQTLLPVVVTY